MKARHYAALSLFITVVLSVAIFLLAKNLKNDPKPTSIGWFEFEGTRTEVVQAGDCQIYMTKYKDQSNPMFFFSCGQVKR